MQDLVNQFETGAVDAKWRKLGWAMALLEMLVDPMLMSWVPDWVHEQYERWNEFFRPCVRQAHETCREKTLVLRRLVDKRIERRGIDGTAEAQQMREDAPAGKTVPNPYYLRPEARTNKRFWFGAAAHDIACSPGRRGERAGQQRFA